jgi:SAM-dependent methyltransferase
VLETRLLIRKVLFFCRPSFPVEFNEPVRYTVRYRQPVARFLIGCLPVWLAKPFMTVHVSERIVELPFVFANLRVPRGALIVDLGCVESKLSLELANRGYKVLGVDLRPYPFRHPNLRTLCGDFVTSPIAEDSVDAVLAVSTLEHFGFGSYGRAAKFSSDVAAISKIRRILKPGGQLILTVPYGLRGQTSWYRVYDRAGLRNLLADFAIDKLEFYHRTGTDAWEETNDERAAGIPSPFETNCVALVSASAVRGGGGHP